MSIVTTLKNIAINNPNAPRRELDPIIPPVGAVWLFDAHSEDSWAKQAAPIAGETVKNLVRGGAPATFEGDLTGMTFAGEGFQFTPNSRLDIGHYALEDQSFLMIVWCKIVSGVYGLGGILGSAVTAGGPDGTNYSGNRFLITNYVDGTGARVLYWKAEVNDNTYDAVPLVDQGVHPGVVQLAWEFNAEVGRVRGYVNGQMVRDAPTFSGMRGLRGQTHPLAIGGWNANDTIVPFNGRVYRSYCEDITASGRTGLEVVRRDYALRNGVYS